MENPEQRGEGGTVCLQGLLAVPGACVGLRPRRWRSWLARAGVTPKRGDWPAGYPPDKRPAYSLADHSALANGLRASASNRSASSSVGSGPTARRCRRGGACSRRGDRARAFGTCRRAYGFDEIEREVPSPRCSDRRSPSGPEGHWHVTRRRGEHRLDLWRPRGYAPARAVRETDSGGLPCPAIGRGPNSRPCSAPWARSAHPLPRCGNCAIVESMGIGLKHRETVKRGVGSGTFDVV